MLWQMDRYVLATNGRWSPLARLQALCPAYQMLVVKGSSPMFFAHLPLFLRDLGRLRSRSSRGWIAGAALGVGLAASAPAAHAGQLETAFTPNPVASAETVDHAAWDKLLKAYVIAGKDGLNRVAYQRFKSEGHASLKAYLAMLQSVDVKQLGRAEQYAFWANLYNAKTIDIVLDKYPVASIKDIRLGGGLFAVVTGGPWKKKVVTVNAIKLSLDDIEHKILRALFKDARVHYAVNCASVGCPNLRRDAFRGSTLEVQLDAGARDYINSARGFAMKGGGITASKIYTWFKADFGGSAKGAIAHALKYAKPKLSAALKAAGDIDDYAYDWQLNDAKL
jgi:hypothetical protein